jgi:hypothetical protein
LVPKAAQIAVLINPNFGDFESRSRELSAASRTLSRRIEYYRASTDAELELAFSRIAQANPAALLPTGDPFFDTRRERIIAFAAQSHASLLGWHDFGAGPRAGDRAADARLMLCPGRESVRFFQRLRGTTHHLVLFAGALATGETHRRLQALADATMHAYPDRIEPHLIVPHGLPEDLVGKGEILLDPRGELHHRYGARSACLYVVRPDGYIGFRSQPPDPEGLRSYLTQIFL